MFPYLPYDSSSKTMFLDDCIVYFCEGIVTQFQKPNWSPSTAATTSVLCTEL